MARCDSADAGAGDAIKAPSPRWRGEEAEESPKGSAADGEDASLLRTLSSSSSRRCSDGTALGAVVAQLSKGEGELFDCVERSGSRAGYMVCAICSKNFADTETLEGRHEVKVLACFHSVCGPCLDSALNNCASDNLECPICCKNQEKKALHQYLPHFEVHSQIDSTKIAQCDFVCEECVSGDQAQYYCTDCVVNLCSACARQHQRAKATVHHGLTSLQGQEAGRPAAEKVHRAQFCAIHRHSLYELYCEDCDVLICQQCAKEAHQSHNYKLPSAALIERHRREVEDTVERLSKRLLEAQEMHRFINKSCEAMDHLASKARADLVAAVDGLLATTDSRCAELKHRLQDGYLDRRSAVEKEKAKCSTALVDIWRTIDFLEKVISRGTDVEVLKATGHVFRERNQLQQLQQWEELAHADASSLWIEGDIAAGWASPEEAEALLRDLAHFGAVEAQPRLARGPALAGASVAGEGGAT